MATFPEPRDSYDQEEERRFRRYLEQELLALRALTEEEPEEEPLPDLSYDWEIISETALDTAAETINLTGLDALGYEEYFIRLFTTRGEAGTRDLYMTLNEAGDGDPSLQNYETDTISMQATYSGTRDTFRFRLTSFVVPSERISEWWLRRVPVDGRLPAEGAGVHDGLRKVSTRGYLATASNLDTVEFSIQADSPAPTFAAGSKAVLFGRNTPELPA